MHKARTDNLTAIEIRELAYARTFFETTVLRLVRKSVRRRFVVVNLLSIAIREPDVCNCKR